MLRSVGDIYVCKVFPSVKDTLLDTSRGMLCAVKQHLLVTDTIDWSSTSSSILADILLKVREESNKVCTSTSSYSTSPLYICKRTARYMKVSFIIII